MDNILDEIIQEATHRLFEIPSDIDVQLVISNARDAFSGIIDNFSDYTSLPEDIKESIINSIVEQTGSGHNIIAQNLDFVTSVNENSFSGIDSENFTSIDFGVSEDSISFCGDNTDAIKYEQERLNAANHDIEYYEREIRNFNEKTSATHRSNCISKLQQATSKAKEAASKIQSLKNK